MQFSDDLFHGCELKIHLFDDCYSLEEFSDTLLAFATSTARKMIEDTGFERLLEEWDRKKWHIHDLIVEDIIEPPDTIWICSHCD